MMYFQIDEKYSWKVTVSISHGREPQEVALLMSKGRKGKGKGMQLGDREKLLSKQPNGKSKMLNP